MTSKQETRAVSLPNGVVAHFEVSVPAGESAPKPESYTNVGFKELSFEGVIGAVEGVASVIGETLKKVKPTSAAVELGVELAVKEGKLLAVFVQGEGKANLKVTLTWGSAEAKQ